MQLLKKFVIVNRRLDKDGVNMLIVPIKGNVKFPITLDPGIWIFDDRKMSVDDAFNKQVNENETDDDTKYLYDGPLNRPPIRKSSKKIDKEVLFSTSYCIPIKDFLKNAECHENATSALLSTSAGDVTISLEQLENSLFQFSLNGKQLKEDGPVYLLFGDGSNKDNPIKGVQLITIQ